MPLVDSFDQLLGCDFAWQLWEQHPSAGADDSGVAEEYQGADTTLTRLDFYLRKFGAPVGTGYCAAVHESGGVETYSTNGQLIRFLTAAWQLKQFTFAGVAVTDGDKVGIVLISDNGLDATKGLEVKLGSGAACHAPLRTAWYYDNGAWRSMAAIQNDFYFYAYGEGVGLSRLPLLGVG